MFQVLYFIQSDTLVRLNLFNNQFLLYVQNKFFQAYIQNKPGRLPYPRIFLV